MEGTSALGGLFTSAGEVVTGIMGFLSEVATGLITNPIFLIMIGIALLYIALGVVFRLVRKMRKGGN